jgi:hypothetical protein
MISVALRLSGYLLLIYMRRLYHALGIWYLPMNSSTESCDCFVSHKALTREHQQMQCTYPILTLMRNPPPINRNPPPILLRPRPLNRQIRITHQRLPNIIKAVINMFLLVLKQLVVRLSRRIVVHAGLEREKERAHVIQAVQLVEDGDVVDFAFGVGVFCVHSLACWEVVGSGVGNKDEAVAGG